jgi:phenylacetate-coenzyme A ligase PaaK-like adenylate-forming protein
MDVWVEVKGPGVDKEAFRGDCERRLKEVLGVRVQVTPVDKGELDQYTGTSSTSKVKRLLDRRHR